MASFASEALFCCRFNLIGKKRYASWLISGARVCAHEIESSALVYLGKVAADGASERRRQREKIDR